MMLTRYPVKQKNKLELYLNDVYEKECEFKIEQEEIEFIQTGIETLVQDLVDQLLEHSAFDKIISNEIDTDYFKQNLYNDKTLVEVYFPIQSDCSLQRYAAENTSHININKGTIIKVGSFYDGTKNDFPDEFDFIFPVLGIRPEFSIPLLSHGIHHTVLDAISKYVPSLQYPQTSNGHKKNRKLYFKGYIGKHGPALEIRFFYNDGFGEIPIHVDLVPAFKIIDSNTNQWFVERIKKYVKPKTFREQILLERNCLYVLGDLAFTEIEQHFMQNILSKKHVKVYRILKHLLNGNGDGENLKRIKNEIIYTSYRIKVLMIYHHESCSNTGTDDLGPCVLQVLKEMSKYESKDKFPSFFFKEPSTTQQSFRVLPYLKSTITTLQSMQTLEEDYNYERDKMKSVSRQYWNCVIL